MLAKWHSTRLAAAAPRLQACGAAAASAGAVGCRGQCGRIPHGMQSYIRSVAAPSLASLMKAFVFSRRRGPAPCAAGGADLSPEEEAAYEAFKAKRKAERQQQRDEHKRRRAFDPLTPRRAPAPPVSSPDAPPAAPGRTAARSAGGLAAAEADVRAGSPLEPDMDQLLAQMMETGDVPEVEELPDDIDMDGMGGDGAERTAQAAQEAALRRQRVSVPARRRRLSPAQLRAASLVQGQAEKLQRSASTSSSGSSASSASTSATAAGVSSAGAAAAASNEQLLRELMGADGEVDDEDDINWEALGKYEEMEATAIQEAQRREAARQRAATRAAASGASQKSPPAARPLQQPQGKQQQLPRTASAASTAPPSAMDRDLAELEGLLGFLEAMEEGGSSGKRSSGSRQSSGGVAIGSGEDGDDEINWGQLEASLFGEGWEADLIRELEADLESDEGEEGQGAGGIAVEEEEEGEPWADEVTALLLGLVMASHQKYLDRPLLDTPVAEEERATAVWSAPFALLVLDDSRQQQLEYANAAATELFGRGYLDLFGVAGHDLVAPDEQSQAEWAFALRDADDSFGRHSVIPRLELVAANGRRVVAKDVIVFQVDSLEDTPVGQAVVVRDWAFE